MSPSEQQLMLSSGKLISMSQAAQYTPYSGEYLSLLARKGRIKAVKISRDWLTTDYAVREYLERQKEKHNKISSQFSSYLNMDSQGFLNLKILTGLFFAAVIITELFFCARFIHFSPGQKIVSAVQSVRMPRPVLGIARQSGEFGEYFSVEANRNAAALGQNILGGAGNAKDFTSHFTAESKKTFIYAAASMGSDADFVMSLAGGMTGQLGDLAQNFAVDIKAPYIAGAGIIRPALLEQKNQGLAFVNSFTSDIKAPYIAAAQIIQTALAEQASQPGQLVAFIQNKINRGAHQFAARVVEMGAVSNTSTTPSRQGGTPLLEKEGNAPRLNTDKGGASPPVKGEYLAKRGEGVGVSQGQVLAATTGSKAPVKLPAITTDYINNLIISQMDKYTAFLASFGLGKTPTQNQPSNSGSGQANGATPGFAGPNGMVQNDNGKTTSVIGGTPIITYIPFSAPNNNVGGSLAGFTNLSGQSFSANTANISGSLIVQGNSSFNSGTFTGSLSAATSTFSNLIVTGIATIPNLAASNITSLTVTGPATFLSSTTIANLFLAQPLSLSSGGIGFNGSAIQKGGLFAGTGGNALGILPVGLDGLCLLASSTAASGISWTSCAVAANAITSLNGQTNPVQTFAIGTDPNITLTISSALGIHTFTPGFTGQLSVARGGTGTSTPGAAGSVAYWDGSILRATQVGITGQFLMSNGINAPSFTSTSTLFGGTPWLITGNTLTSTGTLGTLSNNDLNIITNGTTKLTVLANGNVGIGTTGPTAQLHIVKAGQAQFDLQDSTTGGTPSAGAHWRQFVDNVGGGGGNLTYGFYDVTNSAIRMGIDNSGNVGIGTTSPSALLTVGNNNQFTVSSVGVVNEGTVTNTGETVNGALSVNTSGIGPQIAANFNNTDVGGTTSESRIVLSEGGSWYQGIAGKYNNGSPYLGFSVNSTANTWNEVMRLQSNGNVGIGTTTPLQILSIAGNMRLTGAFFDANNASGIAGQILTSTGIGTAWSSTSTLASSLGAFIQGGNTFGATGTLGTLDNNALNIITNGTAKLTVLANGNVGIGTTSPAFPLDVSGTIASG